MNGPFNSTPNLQSNFWLGRTAYLCKGGLRCIAKIHNLTNSLVTFTLIMLEKKHTLTQAELDYYKPSHTFTVSVGSNLTIRTLDDAQSSNLAQLKPIVKVGTW